MNKLTTTKSLLIGAIAFSAIFTSCSVKKDDAVPLPVIPSSNGVYVNNEGNYSHSNGSISFFNTNTKTISNDIYGAANNGATLGDVVQSMNIIDSTAYIVVNASNKIEIVKASTFAHITTLTNVGQPRYILPVSAQKAYITQCGAGGTTGAIQVLNLSNNTITKTITLGSQGANKLIKHGDNVYIACSGGYGYDETVAIVNTITDAVSTPITVGPNPSSIVEDAAGKIWVLCAGQYNPYPTPGLQKSSKLVRINPTTNTVDATFDFTSKTSEASGLTINANKTTLFYNYDGKVYSLLINATALNKTGLINMDFYGLGVDPITNVIYGAVAGDYSNPGKIFRYNANGTVLDSASAGIGTAGFFFK